MEGARHSGRRSCEMHALQIFNTQLPTGWQPTWTVTTLADTDASVELLQRSARCQASWPATGASIIPCDHASISALFAGRIGEIYTAACVSCITLRSPRASVWTRAMLLVTKCAGDQVLTRKPPGMAACAAGDGSPPRATTSALACEEPRPCAVPSGLTSAAAAAAPGCR